jgi:two-component system LytT family sensor kinase
MVRKFPPWLLIPIGIALFRSSVYEGELWWLLVLVALAADIGVLYVLVQLAERIPLGRGQPRRNLWAYVLTAAIFIATTGGLQELVLTRDHGADHQSETLLHSILGEAFSFLVWTGLAHAIVYLRRYHAAEAQSLRLRLDLAAAARKSAEAELRSFENELNPRFLIGALRSAAEHVESDPARSDRLLVEIGDVVRAARPVSRSTTLGDEIDALQPFLSLERDRLNQDIVLTSRVEDELLDESLPPLVLPALVREALRGAAEGGSIAVDIVAESVESHTGRQLQVNVSRSQTGGASRRVAREDGVLSRTIDHLRSAYAGEATIEIAKLETGVRVTLTVPLADDEAAHNDTSTTQDAFPPARVNTSSRTQSLVIAVCFLTITALNINTAFTRTHLDGLSAPAALAIVEAVLGAAPITFILFVALRLTQRSSGARLVGLHAGAAVGLGILNGLHKWAFIAAAGYPYAPFTAQLFAARTLAGILAYAILASAIGAFEYARRFRTSEEKGLRLQAELAEADRRRIDAELRALKADLNPHFLGNALTGASSLMQTDPAAAREVLTKLADAVGSVVTRVGTQEVTLQEEIDSITPFIAVEQSRFGDRLSVHWNVDTEARAARVPHLILQPLVENAVKHGLAAPSGGQIIVGGRRMGERLELTVQDNGVGIEQAKHAKGVPRSGIGLSNSRARLEQLYGGSATLHLEPAPGAGTIVRVTLPLR